jgi:site-specific DNA recombinase
MDSIRQHVASIDEAEPPTIVADRDLIERYLVSVIVNPQALEVRLVLASDTSTPTEDCNTIMLARTAPGFAAVKGIVHAPSAKPELKLESRDALLIAIVQARAWIDDIRLGRIASFAEIAQREAQGERYVRQLATLAFVSPRIIAAIVDGTAPADLTVTVLAKALPYSWAEQEQSIGLLQ